MQYKLTKTISGIRIVPDGEKDKKAIVDYTITGTATHNGTTLNINEGISVEVPIPQELVNAADSLAEEQLSQKYKND